MRFGIRIVGIIGLVAITASATQADVFHMVAGQTSLEFVTVGDPGNANDTGGCLDLGAVAYVYKIAKFDVTSAQYCQFLNAVAATDTYGLSNPFMENVGGPYSYPPTRCGCGIKRSGVPGRYTYSVLPDSGVPGKPGYANYANFPVNYVSWGDAVRFCNWLQNGQPTGTQGPGTTETGAYTLNGAITDKQLMGIKRNSGAAYFLPTMHEWHKAAFYKGGGTNAGYWRYPTKSDTPPSNVFSSTGTNNANFLDAGYTDPVNFLTPVGFFAKSPGPYGTYDMGGNVEQLTESPLFKMSRFVLGASFQHPVKILAKTSLGNYYPSLDSNVQGFRVANLPAGFKAAKLASPESRSQSPVISDAPEAVRELSAAIQGKSPAEVRTVIGQRFGPPQRNIGFGLRIEQWDIPGGVLTFHPITGPTFFDTKAQRSFRLLQTTNPVHANLLQSYEMTTLPDPANHETRYWLGNLQFGPQMSYTFQDNGQHRNQRGAQAENYFMLHPTGKVAVHYVAPISSHTLLETVPEGAIIAHLIFTSADGKSQATFSITSSQQSRRLEFGGDKPLSFVMDTSWKSLWK